MYRLHTCVDGTKPYIGVEGALQTVDKVNTPHGLDVDFVCNTAQPEDKPPLCCATAFTVGSRVTGLAITLNFLIDRP